MHRTAVLSTLALTLASQAIAQDFDTEDIAPACVTVCSNIVTTVDACDRQFDDNDTQELNCICNGEGMSSQIPECEACQRQYYAQDDDYEEIRSLLMSCGFSSMSATGTMTSMGSAPTGAGGVLTTVTSTYTETDDDDDDNDIDLETTTFTSVLPATTAATTTNTGGGMVSSVSDAGTSATGAVGDAAGSATDAVGSAASSATDAAGSVVSQDESGNFAPAVTAAPVLALAGVAAAVFGI